MGLGLPVVSVCFLFLCVLVSVVAFGGVIGDAVGMLLGGVFWTAWAVGVALPFLLFLCLGGEMVLFMVS